MSFRNRLRLFFGLIVIVPMVALGAVLFALTARSETGKADAGVNDNGLLAYYVSQNDDVEITTEFQTGEKYGFSVKKGDNDALLKAINQGIASPEYDQVYKKWFGESPS